MADINQIIDKNVVAELNRMNQQIILLGKNYDDLIPKLNASTEAQTKNGKATKDQTEQEKQLVAATKELDAINKQILTTDAKINALTTEASKLLAKKKLELQQSTQALKEEATGEKAAAEAKKQSAAAAKLLATETKAGEKAATAAAKATEKAAKEQSKKNQIDSLAETSLVKMRLKLKELTTEYDKAGTRTKAATAEINNLSKAIAKAEEATNRHGREVGNYGKMWEGLKGMLPIVSIAAVGAAIVSTFNSIKNSTHATADAFEFATNGMKSGIDQFWRTLATGDWTNFTTRMAEAIRGGYEFASMMDEVDDRLRAFSMMDADSKEKAIDLEIKMRNGLISPEERKKAGLERLALEETLVEKRKSIAQLAFDANEKEALRLTGFYEEQKNLTKTQNEELYKIGQKKLDIIAKDIDSQKKSDAKVYKAKVDQYEKMRKLNTATVGGGGVSGGSQIQLEDTPEMILIKKEIDFTEKAVVEYAGLLKQFDNMKKNSADKGEVTQDSFTKAYNNLKDAAVSGKENTRKVYRTISTAEAEITADAKKANEDAKKAAADRTKAEKEAAEKRVKIWADETWAKQEQKNEQQKIDEKYLEDFAKLIDDELDLEDAKQEKIIEATIAAGEKILDEKQKLSEKEKDQRIKNEEDFKQAAIQQGQELGNYLFESKKKQLELEFQAAEGNAEKQAAIKRKIAQADKKQALFNIAVNTAVAVSKVWGQTGIGGILAQWPVLAMGVIQAAMVAAQKVPEFATGTEFAPGGLSMVGERGRELIRNPRGEVYLANNPALVNLERGSKVINNSRTEAYLNDGNIVSELRQTRKAIQRMPQPVFLNGSKIAERRGNYWKEYISQKHRLN